MTSIANTSLWLLFGLITLGLLALDLLVFHRKAHVVGTREALTWSVVWIAVALAFNGAIYWQFGSERGLEFLTGYLVEKALAVDNLFVFVVVFSYFTLLADTPLWRLCARSTRAVTRRPLAIAPRA